MLLLNVINFCTESITASSILEMSRQIEKYHPLRLHRAYSIGDSHSLNVRRDHHDHLFYAQ